MMQIDAVAGGGGSPNPDAAKKTTGPAGMFSNMLTQETQSQSAVNAVDSPSAVSGHDLDKRGQTTSSDAARSKGISTADTANGSEAKELAQSAVRDSTSDAIGDDTSTPPSDILVDWLGQAGLASFPFIRHTPKQPDGLDGVSQASKPNASDLTGLAANNPAVLTDAVVGHTNASTPHKLATTVDNEPATLEPASVAWEAGFAPHIKLPDLVSPYEQAKLLTSASVLTQSATDMPALQASAPLYLRQKPEPVGIDASLKSGMREILAQQAPIKEVAMALPECLPQTLASQADWQESANDTDSLGRSSSLFGLGILAASPQQTMPQAVVPQSESVSVEQVKHWAVKDLERAQFDLKGLGQSAVQVDIQIQGQIAQISFNTDDIQARQLLQGALPELSAMLAKEGLQLSGASVGTSEQGRGQTPLFIKPPEGSGLVSSDETSQELLPSQRTIRDSGPAGAGLDLYV